MDVYDIVAKWLEDSEYDGLYSDGECACKKDDLAPCGNMEPSCQAGYLQPGNKDWEFFIGPEKPTAETPQEIEE